MHVYADIHSCADTSPEESSLARQITFNSVELDDFRQFRGHQVFDLARAAEPDASALTVITGGGGFGKTSLVTAM